MCRRHVQPSLPMRSDVHDCPASACNHQAPVGSSAILHCACHLTPALLAAQEFSPSGDGGTPVTMGAYARDLFLDQVRLPARFCWQTVMCCERQGDVRGWLAVHGKRRAALQRATLPAPAGAVPPHAA